MLPVVATPTHKLPPPLCPTATSNASQAAQVQRDDITGALPLTSSTEGGKLLD